MQDSADPGRHVVTAVLVVHDGARWLPDTLKALLTQTRQVQRLVVVDTGSTDTGHAVLAEVVGDGNLITLPATTGYGEAVAAALAHPASSLRIGDGGTEWVWLLHDDSTPDQHALESLLHAADSDPGIAVLGAKLRDWDDRRLLLEIGSTVDGFGRRETGVERGELDQGQHDGKGVRDALAVSSAGMLVRRDVWRRLGGFDPRLKLFRDDLDFGWRARADGHRVVAVSGAVVYHAEATARGLRPVGALPGVSASRLDRGNALFVLLTNLPVPATLRALARNLLGSVLRAIGLALGKRPQAARDEMGAVADVLLHPLALYRGRVNRRPGRRRVYRSSRRLMARRVLLRRYAEWLAAVISGDRVLRPARGRRGDGEEGLFRRALRSPGIVLLLVLTLISVIACRSLLTAGGQLGGGALLPGEGGLWGRYLAGWQPVGLGSNTGSPPYVGVLALLATPLLGHVWLLLTIMLVGAVPLSGLTAYLAAHTLIPDGPRVQDGPGVLEGAALSAGTGRIPGWMPRVWLAATYALLPVTFGAVAAGRIGTVVVLVLLPLMGMLAWRVLRPRRRPGVDPRLQARRAAWGLGVLLTVATAFVPLIWLLAILVGVLAVTAMGAPARLRGDHGGDLAVILGLPFVLLLPWMLGLLAHPSRFLLQAGLNRSELVTTRLPARDLLFLGPGGPGAPAWWLTAGLLVVAAVALPLRARQVVTLSGWMLALFGLLAGILVSALDVRLGADEARAWPGVALLVASTGLIIAATAAVQRAADVLASGGILLRAGAGLVALAAVSTPLLAAGTWLVQGTDGPVGRVPDVFAQILSGETQTGSRQFRTLIIQRKPGRAGVSYTVVRATPSSLGDEATPTTQAASRRMDAIVAEFAAGHGDAFALARMGVQYIYVPDPGHDPLVAPLDATPDVYRLGRNSSFALWLVVPEAGRLLLTDGSTTTALAAHATGASVRIPPGRPGRTLLLAEPDDGGWHASLNGAGLHPFRADGWAVGYRIPASGGHFTLSHGMLSRHLWLVFQALALVTAVIAAIPSPEDEILRRRAGVRRADELRNRAARVGAAAGAAARSRARQGAAHLPKAVRSLRPEPDADPQGGALPDTDALPGADAQGAEREGVEKPGTAHSWLPQKLGASYDALSWPRLGADDEASGDSYDSGEDEGVRP